MESTSEMETALQFYEAARDNLSLVRVYCYCGNLEKVSVTYSARQRSVTLLSKSSEERTLVAPAKLAWRRVRPSVCRVNLDYPCEKRETVG